MRAPDVSRRTFVVGATAVSLVLVCVIALAVPSTREELAGAWCALTAQDCAEREGPTGGGGLAESDWRVQLAPEAAATWGNYLALGDSYSSGDGAGEYFPHSGEGRNCRRSGNAYPQKVADGIDLTGELGFVACSKQRGWAMLDAIGSATSQLDAIGTHTSLVTLGIGGNDLGFTSVLKTCMVRVPLTETDACIGQKDDIDRRMRTFDSTLEDLLTEIRQRAPSARVLVVGYPRLFPADPDGMYYTLTVDDQKWLNATVREFNDRLADAVEAADSEIAEAGKVGSVEFVDLYTTLKGHEVDSEHPWVHGVLLRDLTEGVTVDRGSFHPNADGQAAFGKRVTRQIEKGPGRPLYAGRETVENASPEVLAAEAG